MSSLEFEFDDTFLNKALYWASLQERCCYLNPNNFQYPHEPFKHLLAVGASEVIKSQNITTELRRIRNEQKWCFGFISYDYKNQLEKLTSSNYDGIELHDYEFFVPEILIHINGEKLFIEAESPSLIYNEINNIIIEEESSPELVEIKQRLTKEQYIRQVEHLQDHILRGDIYEVNFCQEFYAENTCTNPLNIYQKLNKLSPAPFSAFLKVENHFLISSSPERFIKKEGSKLISQPIKGTAARGKTLNEDQQNKDYLFKNSKERAENVMIVDLVRNDLSQFCKPGTVKVEELCGIYSFPQVHQMISTVIGELEDSESGIEAMLSCFPMGSMTGAPKLRAMELIENYESTKRGLFSGCVGYISPAGDYDFNVVIRSILYNSTNQYLSFQTGSAITYHADAATEYDECQLKASAIKKVLS